MKLRNRFKDRVIRDRVQDWIKIRIRKRSRICVRVGVRVKNRFRVRVRGIKVVI